MGGFARYLGSKIHGICRLFCLTERVLRMIPVLLGLPKRKDSDCYFINMENLRRKQHPLAFGHIQFEEMSQKQLEEVQEVIYTIETGLRQFGCNYQVLLGAYL